MKIGWTSTSLSFFHSYHCVLIHPTNVFYKICIYVFLVYAFLCNDHWNNPSHSICNCVYSFFSSSHIHLVSVNLFFPVIDAFCRAWNVFNILWFLWCLLWFTVYPLGFFHTLIKLQTAFSPLLSCRTDTDFSLFFTWFFHCGQSRTNTKIVLFSWYVRASDVCRGVIHCL